MYYVYVMHITDHLLLLNRPKHVYKKAEFKKN